MPASRYCQNLAATMKILKEAWNWATTECDAWNRRDLEAIMMRYAEDVALSSPAVVTRMGCATVGFMGKQKFESISRSAYRPPTFISS
jgi:ketosteroid isomerase-like protein